MYKKYTLVGSWLKNFEKRNNFSVPSCLIGFFISWDLIIKDNIMFKKVLLKHMYILFGFIAVLLSACNTDNKYSEDNPMHQLTSWHAAQMDINDTGGLFPPQKINEFNNQTIRQISRLAIGGESLKVKFSNEYGKEPLILENVKIAKSLGGSKIDNSNIHKILFEGKERVEIPVGGSIFSDEVKFSTSALDTVAISIYLKNAKLGTMHYTSTTKTFVGSDDQTSEVEIANPIELTSSFFMPQIDVIRPDKVPVIVAFGDSITDGAINLDAHNNYVDQLNEKFISSSMKASVINSGLSGNRLTRDIIGKSGNSRFIRDVLDISGVSHVIILIGINDIGLSYDFSKSKNDASQLVSSDELINSLKQRIKDAKSKNIKVYIATITPFKNAHYYTDGSPSNIPGGGLLTPYNGEKIRQEVNTFIRNNTEIDGVIDFDKALQDPLDPLQQVQDYHIGDYLHPNSVGYKAMVNSIDLNIFK